MAVIIKERSQKSVLQEPFCLINDKTLIDRDKSQRFGPYERLALRQEAVRVGEEILADFPWAEAETVWYQGEIVNYNPLERGVVIPRPIWQESQVKGERVAIVISSLRDENDFGLLRDYLEANKIYRSVVVTSFLPGSRADRECEDGQGNIRYPSMPRHFKDLRNSGVEALIGFDIHSPGATYYGLKEGLPIIDLSLLPMLLAEGLRQLEEMGFEINKEECAILSGDDGSREPVLLLKHLLSLRKIIAKTVRGVKSKYNGYDIDAPEEEWEKFDMSIAFDPDDVISSGKTLVAGLKKIMSKNPKLVLVLAPHELSLEGIGDRLRKADIDLSRVVIITTNGVQPVSDMSSEVRVVRLRIEDPVQQMVNLFRDGTNIFNSEGQTRLLEVAGMTLNAWLTQDPFELRPQNS